MHGGRSQGHSTDQGNQIREGPLVEYARSRLILSSVQCSAITGYGAKLVKCEVSPTSRKETCQKIADENPGFQIVHPYDDVNVIAGQSTIALELHEQVAGLDAIVVPVSGGGMSSGIALATKAMNPACKIILTAPEV